MKPGVHYIGVSAGALLLNDKGKVLLCKRSANSKNERGYWGTPGGQVAFGERLEHAVRREVKEELGVDIEILEQLPADNHLLPKEEQHWVVSTFLAKVKKGQKPKVMEPNKCDALGWFPLNHLPKPLTIVARLGLKSYKGRL